MRYVALEKQWSEAFPWCPLTTVWEGWSRTLLAGTSSRAIIPGGRGPGYNLGSHTPRFRFAVSSEHESPRGTCHGQLTPLAKLEQDGCHCVPLLALVLLSKRPLDFCFRWVGLEIPWLWAGGVVTTGFHLFAPVHFAPLHGHLLWKCSRQLHLILTPKVHLIARWSGSQIRTRCTMNASSFCFYLWQR